MLDFKSHNGLTTSLEEVNKALLDEVTPSTCSTDFCQLDVSLQISKCSVNTASSGTDSGYQSAHPSPDIKISILRSEDETPRRQLWPSKRKTLQPAGIGLNARQQSRFDDLKCLIATSLAQYLGKKKLCCSAIQLYADVLREPGREDTARLFIIICCVKSDRITKHIKSFLNKSDIKAELQSGDDLRPSFDVIVKERLHLFMRMNLPVFSSVPVKFEPQGMIILGQPISIVTWNGIVHTTLGGMITTQSRYGPIHHYGLTVGHMIPKEAAPSIEDVDCPDVDNNGNREDGDDFSSDVFTCSDYEDDILIEGWGDDQYANGETKESGIFSLPAAIGEVVMASSSRFGTNFDWALIKLVDDFSSDCIALTTRDSEQIPFSTQSMQPGQRVSASLAGRSTNLGWIQLRETSMMIGSSGSFAQVFSFKSDTFLGPGDSGTWLLDKETNSVLGHIVGKGLYNEILVMPIDAILSDIQRAAGVDNAWLYGANLGKTEKSGSRRSPNFVEEEENNGAQHSVTRSTSELLQDQQGLATDSHISHLTALYESKSYTIHREMPEMTEEKGHHCDSGYVSNQSSPRMDDGLGIFSYREARMSSEDVVYSPHLNRSDTSFPPITTPTPDLVPAYKHFDPIAPSSLASVPHELVPTYPAKTERKATLSKRAFRKLESGISRLLR